MQNLSQVVVDGLYYKPSSSNFKTVDAVVKRSTDTWDFFQMTVGKSKELDASNLSDMLTNMNLPNSVTPRLHFVVSEDKYSAFKLTKKNWPPKQSQAASRLQLYIVKGVYNFDPVAGVGRKRRRTTSS